MSNVLTVGTFDLYHAGHVNFLYQCAKIAGIIGEGHHSPTPNHHVTVGLNSDEFVQRYKGKKPIYSFKERVVLLSNNKYVWNVKENNTRTIEPLLTLKYEPFDFLVIGSDWATKDYYAQIGVTQEWLDEKGITLCYVPYTQGVSTSILKERIIGS